MKEISNKSYIVTICISVFCLLVIIFSAAYAFFVARIEGEGTDIDVLVGNVNLEISESKISASLTEPIYDSNKETRAASNSFTINRKAGSNLNACYSVSLAIDKIGENLRNKWFKYELVYGSESIQGNFAGITLDASGKAIVPLVLNQEVNDTNTSNSYVLRLWLSYDENEDQAFILKGNADSKTFEGHIVASGVSGSCSTN